MRKCNDKCYPLCDFCKHYQFNGDDLIRNGKTFKGAIYTGKGFCTFHHRRQEPQDQCDNFHCKNVKDVN